MCMFKRDTTIQCVVAYNKGLNTSVNMHVLNYFSLCQNGVPRLTSHSNGVLTTGKLSSHSNDVPTRGVDIEQNLIPQEKGGDTVTLEDFGQCLISLSPDW